MQSKTSVKLAENVLPDVTGEISCVQRVCGEAPDDAWNWNIANAHGIDARQIGLR